MGLVRFADICQQFPEYCQYFLTLFSPIFLLLGGFNHIGTFTSLCLFHHLFTRKSHVYHSFTVEHTHSHTKSNRTTRKYSELILILWTTNHAFGFRWIYSLFNQRWIIRFLVEQNNTNDGRVSTSQTNSNRSDCDPVACTNDVDSSNIIISQTNAMLLSLGNVYTPMNNETTYTHSTFEAHIEQPTIHTYRK